MKTENRLCPVPVIIGLALVVMTCAPQNAVRRVCLLGGPQDDGAYAICQTLDGGYIIAGSMENEGTGRDMAVIKLTAGFMPDKTFGKEGIFRAGSSGDDQAIDVIELAGMDGSGGGYLVAGYVSSGDGDFSEETFHGKIDIALIRLNAAGRPDPAFGENGVVLMGGSDDDEVIVHLDNYSEPGDRIVQDGGEFIIAAMTRSSDGDLKAVSTIGMPSKRDMLLIKIDGSGHPVASFGDRGFVRIGCTPGLQEKQQGGNDFLFSIEAAGEGEYIGLGYTVGKEIPMGESIVRSSGNNDVQGQNESCDSGPCYKMDGLAIRFRADGTLAGAWADQGVLFIGGTRQEKMYDVVRTTDGCFLMTGRTSSVDLDMTANKGSGDEFDAFVARLTDTGRLDSTFASGGVLFLSGTGSDRAHRVCELGRGRFAVLIVSDSNDDLFRPFTGAESGDESYICIADVGGRIEKIIPLGGSGKDNPTGMILNREGNLVITGRTESTDGVFTGTPSHGGKEVFVIEVDWE
jgi:hypothetical protein